MAGMFREVLKNFRSFTLFEIRTRGPKRSGRWSTVRKIHLRANPYCANCGKKKRIGMQVHHITPFSVDPSLELVPTNLLTLCNNPRCHLDKGHLGNFRSWNVNVIQDCKDWNNKYTNRPKKTKVK